MGGEQGSFIRTQDCEQDVDQEVGTAASLKEDSYGRQDDGNNDLGDVAVEKDVVSIQLLLPTMTSPRSSGSQAGGIAMSVVLSPRAARCGGKNVVTEATGRHARKLTWM